MTKPSVVAMFGWIMPGAFGHARDLHVATLQRHFGVSHFRNRIRRHHRVGDVGEPALQHIFEQLRQRVDDQIRIHLHADNTSGSGQDLRDRNFQMLGDGTAARQRDFDPRVFVAQFAFPAFTIIALTRPREARRCWRAIRTGRGLHPIRGEDSGGGRRLIRHDQRLNLPCYPCGCPHRRLQ